MNNLIKKNGYYTFEILPTEQELREHYSKKYYQEAGQAKHSSSYNIEYGSNELAHRRFIASLIAKQASLLTKSSQVALDIGCGEGFLLEALSKEYNNVYGIDFSNFALKKFHPQFLDNFVQGNVLDFDSLLAKMSLKIENVDVVTCINVLEHVTEPETLLKKLFNTLKSGAILTIQVPNDFSDLHDFLLENNLIHKQFWLSYPEHLSYFNKDSLTNLISNTGFKVLTILADYPIDLLLLNNHTNYIENTELGPLAHIQRVNTDLFFSKLQITKVLKLYESCADLGIGRNLTFYCRKP